MFNAGSRELQAVSLWPRCTDTASKICGMFCSGLGTAAIVPVRRAGEQNNPSPENAYYHSGSLFFRRLKLDAIPVKASLVNSSISNVKRCVRKLICPATQYYEILWKQVRIRTGVAQHFWTYQILLVWFSRFWFSLVGFALVWLVLVFWSFPIWFGQVQIYRNYLRFSCIWFCSVEFGLVWFTLFYFVLV